MQNLDTFYEGLQSMARMGDFFLWDEVVQISARFGMKLFQTAESWQMLGSMVLGSRVRLGRPEWFGADMGTIDVTSEEADVSRPAVDVSRQ